MNDGEVTKQSHPKVHSSLRKVLGKGRWVPVPIKPVETARVAACPQSYRGKEEVRLKARVASHS